MTLISKGTEPSPMSNFLMSFAECHIQLPSEAHCEVTSSKFCDILLDLSQQIPPTQRGQYCRSIIQQIVFSLLAPSYETSTNFITQGTAEASSPLSSDSAMEKFFSQGQGLRLPPALQSPIGWLLTQSYSFIILYGVSLFKSLHGLGLLTNTSPHFTSVSRVSPRSTTFPLAPGSQPDFRAFLFLACF